MIRILAVAAALATLPTFVARAESPVVVELFTSQGCSSCPPADALLGRLTEREDVLPLSLHVDYWDYIGWADIFAKPSFTRRQKGYAKASGERMIYTPQMIVSGRERLVGPKPMKLAEIIRARGGAPSPVRIAALRRGGELKVELWPAGSVPGSMVVQLVRFLPRAEVEIARGENAGRRLVYHNIVTDWRRLADWDGTSHVSLSVEIDGDDSAAVLVQGVDYGPIFAAASVR